MTKRYKKYAGLLIPAACAAAIVIFAYSAAAKAMEGQDARRLTALSLAVRKAAVQCYASEGFYPPDVKYMEDNYGLIVDGGKYIIYYEAFASNIMPRIDVFPVSGELPSPDGEG